MSSDEDKCYQCQELAHMACYCPQIRCFYCNNYGHVVADCSDKIPPSGTPARHRERTPNTRCHDISLSWSNHWDRHHHYDSSSRSDWCNSHPCDHRGRHRYSRSRSHSHSHRYRSDSHDDSRRKPP